MNMTAERDNTPDWAEEAEEIEHKPEWCDKIPEPLWELCEVFFPIPPKKKGWNYPHHLDSHRFGPKSEILNAYLEMGWGYGVACDNDLAVVDIDEKNVIEDVVSNLPKTVYQWSGSGEGVHLFYYVEGLETRRILQKEFMDERIHLGEIKCDPHGYVVGPGSVHPSGNIYGPLNGDKITSIDKDELLDRLDDYITSEEEIEYEWKEFKEHKDRSDSRSHPFYEMSADDVLPWLEPETRVCHPVHGSTTGTNFMKNSDRETFTCWRCQYGRGPGCGLNARQFLAIQEIGSQYGDTPCQRIRQMWSDNSWLHYYAWKRAVEEGLVRHDSIPYKVLHGYAVDAGLIEEDKPLAGELYHDLLNCLKYEMEILVNPHVSSTDPAYRQYM